MRIPGDEMDTVRAFIPAPTTPRQIDVDPDPTHTKADALERASQLARAATRAIREAVAWLDVVDPGAADYARYGRLVEKVQDLSNLIDLKRGQSL